MLEGQPDHRTWARVEALARPDKWFLSGGDGLVWAPPFPRWLHHPGFWDEARVYHFSLAPVFAVSLVDEGGREDPLEREGIHWRPDRLRIHWRSRSGLSFTETRYLVPGGLMGSAWRTEEDLGWPNPVFEKRWLVAHTTVPGTDALAVARQERGVAWRRLLRAPGEEGETLRVAQSLTVHLFPPRGRHPGAADEASLARISDVRAGALRCEGGDDGPEWGRTPFADAYPAEVPEGWSAEVPDEAGAEETLHLAAGIHLGDLPARHAVGLVLHVRPLLQGNGTDPDEETGGALEPPSRPAPRPARARASWGEAFTPFPRFRCSDPWLSGYPDYRIYGLHLNRLEGGRPNLPHPAVAEGIGPLHHPTAGSAPCHMLETRWSRDPTLARGTLRNFAAHQREDGSLPTRLYVHRAPDDDVCHMNWGDAVRAVHRLHPDQPFLAEAYETLARYGAWVARTRDPEDSGLVTLCRPQEASQEHTPRWEAAAGGEVKAVDASVCALQLWRALAEMARSLDREEAGRWEERRLRAANALESLWDEEAGIYRDLDPATGRLTDVTSSAGLRPLQTSVPSPDRVRRLLAHLEPGGDFATPFPVPTLGVRDPRFDPRGVWRGRRRQRPFNGRVWPAVTSQVLDGLLRQWHRGIQEAGPVAARMLRDFVRMMHSGTARPGAALAGPDVPLPNSWEHYNPLTGRPSLFRGLDDHQRSWVLDLIYRGVAGLEPLPDTLRVHPLPLGLDEVLWTGFLRGREVRIRIRGDEIEATAGGPTRTGPVGAPLEIPW